MPQHLVSGRMRRYAAEYHELVITNASVVDVITGSVLPGKTLVIENGIT
ncbi:hypothetical protein [Pontibacter brevis]